MQNIGKVSSMRRVPPPKWVPSLKAETSVSDNRQIINQSSLGWVNPVSQDNCDSNTIKSQTITTKSSVDKSQWNFKISANKRMISIRNLEFASLPCSTQRFSSWVKNSHLCNRKAVTNYPKMPPQRKKAMSRRKKANRNRKSTIYE